MQMRIISACCPWCEATSRYCYERGLCEMCRCINCRLSFFVRTKRSGMLEIGIVAPWWDNKTRSNGCLRFIRTSVPVSWVSPPEDPEEPKKEKPKDEPKPTPPPPPPPPVFEMSSAAGPYRPKPIATPEPPKESWLRRHKNEIIHILMATAAVASYIVSQTL